MADALDFLHGRGYLHRDVKPQNVLVLKRAQDEWASAVAKLADFGTAKRVLNLGDEEQHTHGLGTFDYRAPEAEEGRYYRQTDVYALGRTMYSLRRQNWNSLFRAAAGGRAAHYTRAQAAPIVQGWKAVEEACTCEGRPHEERLTAAAARDRLRGLMALLPSPAAEGAGAGAGAGTRIAEGPGAGAAGAAAQAPPPPFLHEPPSSVAAPAAAEEEEWCQQEAAAVSRLSEELESQLHLEQSQLQLEQAAASLTAAGGASRVLPWRAGNGGEGGGGGGGDGAAAAASERGGAAASRVDADAEAGTVYVSEKARTSEEQPKTKKWSMKYHARAGCYSCTTPTSVEAAERFGHTPCSRCFS